MKDFLNQIKMKKRLIILKKDIINYLYSLIKEEKIEIIHQNNNDRFILLKLNDNNKITDIELFPLLTDEKSKSNEFMKNYLGKKLYSIKKEINNQNQIIKTPMNITEEDEEVTDKIKSDNDDIIVRMIIILILPTQMKNIYY